VAKFCTIYCRFSPRPNAQESESNAKQIEVCRERARKKGYVEGVEPCQDVNTSGGDDGKSVCLEEVYATRPGLKKAIESLKRGWVLLIRWRNRLARDVFIEELIYRQVARVGATIEAAEDGFNGEDANARFNRHVLAAVAELQRSNIRTATSRGMLRNQAAGRRMSRETACPWGKMVDPSDAKRLIDCPDELETARIARELHSQGAGYGAIAAALQRLGRDRREKSGWDVSAVRRVLKATATVSRSDSARPSADLASQSG
jgi:DNA invertase Pin-like site-specific DNA recombinase